MTGPKRRIGRYAIYEQIAAGGMASVSLARLSGPRGFTKIVAIKSLHAEVARDPDGAAAFLDEARLMSRIRHPNVVAVLDVLNERGELYLVMEYVAGVSLATLMRAARLAGKKVPPAVAGSIVIGVLQGLRAAHEANDEKGRALELVHRDVSPQNVLVGTDGVARVLDFGIAKAVSRSAATRGNIQKGKPGYMAPEQIRDEPIDARADVWGASVVLWELLTGSRLFGGDNDWAVAKKVLERPIDAPGRIVSDLPPELDAVVERGLERDPNERFHSANAMAHALERALLPASTREVGDFVESLVKDELDRLSALVAEIEREPDRSRRDRRPLLWLIALLGLALAAVAAWARMRPAPKIAEPKPEPPPVELLVTPSAEPETLPVTSEATPTPRASSVREPGKSLKLVAPPHPSASSAPAPKSPDCDPPYVVDSEGFHRMKPECLGR